MNLAFSSLRELRVPLAGKLVGTGDTQFSGVSIDTRDLRRGDLFVALRGEHHDGHEFVEQAIAKGSPAMLLSEELEINSPFLLVEDTLQSLGRLGGLNRIAWQGTLFAVTGSNGKTTVKEMLGAILSGQAATLVSAGNQNNAIGVPLTLLKLTEEYDFAVVEIGTDHPGEIAYGGNLARPQVAIITNVALAHIAGLGSKENIAREKGSLLGCISAGGTGIVNGDDEACGMWEKFCREQGRPMLKFGTGESCDLRLTQLNQTNAGTAFTLALSEDLRQALQEKFPPNSTNATNSTLPQQIDVKLGVLGKHNAMNAAAAVLAALWVGIKPDTIAKGLAEFRNLGGRLDIQPLGDNCFLIDDSYNANPSSMAAALETLQSFNIHKGGDNDGDCRRIAVLGEMLELGEHAEFEHQQIGGLAAELGLELLACGKMAAEKLTGYNSVHSKASETTAKPQAFAGTAELNEFLKQEHAKDELKNCVFLVKASRGSHLEEVADFLTQLFAGGKQ